MKFVRHQYRSLQLGKLVPGAREKRSHELSIASENSIETFINSLKAIIINSMKLEPSAREMKVEREKENRSEWDKNSIIGK